MKPHAVWIARTTLAILTLLLVATTAEIVLRFGAWQSEQRARRTAAEWQAAHPKAAALPQLNSVFALAQKNVRGIHKGVLIRTNSLGLRSPEFTPVAAPGTTRIVIAGDSFTFGSGVAEQDIYATRVAALLDRARPDRRHEVINAGLAGAHIGGVVDRLELAIEAYRPGLYVYGFTPNDIEGPAYRLLDEDANTRAWLAWSGRQPLLLVRYVTWYLATLGGPRPPREQSYPRELERNYFENPAAWSRFVTGLERIAALARAADVCGHVLIHTQLIHLGADHPFHPIYDRVAEAARARGLGVSLSFAAFEGRDPETLWINPLDTHPNADGHALLAEALATDLAALPRSCWQRAALERTVPVNPL